ncbi:Nitrous oxide reductase family maturation protein NosD [Sulfidibacter corallicola]|uniref:Nitrous oxide reductase family maturation protein NosD n=1 Tax=Sulfidibacter corallicola TaxID=2818388 RepID=A0A8A4TKB0_SULCO|nr:nitrous oxide reductase family maturation protein NosD [Sulfidibacter corallicola]QTD50449.1 nitrous oxide reductase family maturation protein NosD [Sulfidibacter corallicola]
MWQTFPLALLLWFGGSALAGPARIVVGTDAPTPADALTMANDGDTVVIPAGDWHGPLVVRTAIVLQGEPGAVVKGTGRGTVLRIEAPNVTVEGLVIRDGGNDLDGPDCGIYVAPTATKAILRHNEIHAPAFGIWIHQTEGAEIVGNHIFGSRTGHPSNRGNGIHLFDATGLIIRKNWVVGGRDGIYVSATEHSLIENNRTEKLRYGIHYMYSYDNRVTRNQSIDNVIGFALMQSRNLVVEKNQAIGNQRDGLLFRDAQYCQIRHNLLRENGQGMFFYSSTDNTIRENRLEENQVGVKIWAGSLRNRVTGNVFRGNAKQVFYVGTADLAWGEEDAGNYWDDYLGWDMDGDGLGDRPYRINSFSSHLVHRYPAANLLLRSPALELLTHLEQKLPLFQVPTLIDRAPLLEETDHGNH